MTKKTKTIKEILENNDVYTSDIELELLRNLEFRVNRALSTQREEIIKKIEGIEKETKPPTSREDKGEPKMLDYNQALEDIRKKWIKILTNENNLKL